MTTHENIVEAIMMNGWTKEEATKIKDQYIQRKMIKVDKVNGSWEYTASIWAEKDPQWLALDIANNPQPKGQESDKAHDPYSEGWKAFEDGVGLKDNPYMKVAEGQPDRLKASDWEYGYHARKDIRTKTGR
jgi:hypothetical protein